MTEQEKKPGVLLSPRVDDPPVVTLPERQFGGPQSRLPPPFIVGSALAPHLILGIDFGSNYCRFSSFWDGAAFALQPHEYRALVEDLLGIPVEPNRLVHSLKYCIAYGYSVRYENRLISSTQLVASYLRNIKVGIEKSTAKQISKAVISVPSFFTHRQRTSLIEAASEANISVLGLINESTAAALDRCYLDKFTNGKCLVISGGTYSFEASVIDVQNRLLEVKAIRGDRTLCGHEITCTLAEKVKQYFGVNYPPDLLHSQCDAAKVKLDAGESPTLNLGDKTISVDRELAGKFFAETQGKMRSLLLSLLKDSMVEGSDIKRIYLTGESSRLWLLMDLLTEFFPKLERRWANVSAGASIFAALLTRQTKDWVIWDCLANPVVVAQDIHVRGAVAADSPLPISGHAELMPDKDGRITASILQTRKDSNNDVVPVALVSIVEELPRSESATVDLTLTATANGTFSFAARHKSLDVNLTLDINEPPSAQPFIELAPHHENKQIEGDIGTISLPKEVAPNSSSAPILEQSFGPGISVKNYGGKWFVDSVVEGSAADKAGVQIFSEILKIDGTDARNTALPFALAGPKHRIVEIIFEKRGQRDTLKLARETVILKDLAAVKAYVTETRVTAKHRAHIHALLDYAKLCISQDRVPDLSDYKESLSAAERAVALAHELFASWDTILLKSICLSCGIALRFMSLPGADVVFLERHTRQAYKQIIAIVEKSDAISNAVAKSLMELASEHEAALETFGQKEDLTRIRKVALRAFCANWVPFVVWKDMANSDSTLTDHVVDICIKHKDYLSLDAYLTERICFLTLQRESNREALINSLYGMARLLAVMGEFKQVKTIYPQLFSLTAEDDSLQFEYMVKYAEFLMRIEDEYADTFLTHTERLGRKIGALDDSTVTAWAKEIRRKKGHRKFS